MKFEVTKIIDIDVSRIALCFIDHLPNILEDYYGCLTEEEMEVVLENKETFLKEIAKKWLNDFLLK